MRRLLHPRVSRGARLLDQRRPGWYNEVNLVMLDMTSPYQCVLGQVYRESRELRRGYFLNGFCEGLRQLQVRSARSYGFYSGARAWRYEIKRRREWNDVDRAFGLEEVTR